MGDTTDVIEKLLLSVGGRTLGLFVCDIAESLVEHYSGDREPLLSVIRRKRVYLTDGSGVCRLCALLNEVWAKVGKLPIRDSAIARNVAMSMAPDVCDVAARMDAVRMLILLVSLECRKSDNSFETWRAVMDEWLSRLQEYKSNE